MKTYISTPPDNVKVYRALLQKAGTAAPIATVLENTLGGDVTWNYSDSGKYVATSASLFTTGKTCLPPVNVSISLDSTPQIASFFQIDDSDIRLQTAQADIAGGTVTLSDSILDNTYVQIIVYP